MTEREPIEKIAKLCGELPTPTLNECKKIEEDMAKAMDELGIPQLKSITLEVD